MFDEEKKTIFCITIRNMESNLMYEQNERKTECERAAARLHSTPSTVRNCNREWIRQDR